MAAVFPAVLASTRAIPKIFKISWCSGKHGRLEGELQQFPNDKI